MKSPNESVSTGQVRLVDPTPLRKEWSMEKRRSFPARFKAKVALEALVGDQRVPETSAQQCELVRFGAVDRHQAVHIDPAGKRATLIVPAVPVQAVQTCLRGAIV